MPPHQPDLLGRLDDASAGDHIHLVQGISQFPRAAVRLLRVLHGFHQLVQVLALDHAARIARLEAIPGDLPQTRLDMIGALENPSAQLRFLQGHPALVDQLTDRPRVDVVLIADVVQAAGGRRQVA